MQSPALINSDTLVLTCTIIPNFDVEFGVDLALKDRQEASTYSENCLIYLGIRRRRKTYGLSNAESLKVKGTPTFYS